MQNIDAIGNELPDAVEPDSSAQKEEGVLFGDAQRTEDKKQTLHNLFVTFVKVATWAFIVVFVVRMIHFVLPTCLAWLEDTQLQTIDKSLFSGAVGGMIVNYTRNLIPMPKTDD
ncbi:MAG: hypothetical protein KDA80_19060 [Planctomycetaceae bacterium]|nr:hypothetical protein [Planctomycetaceae bacterium]